MDFNYMSFKHCSGYTSMISGFRLWLLFDKFDSHLAGAFLP